MKTLSVLFTLALLVAANQLAVHLRHAHALPAQRVDRTKDTNAIGPFTMGHFPFSQKVQ
ncbi:MAG TPA: hypothetical protein VKV04_02460 [Verrucomicrobiae bacterium]|nr:hypothetical protein [Verrucomicrobiae bacterium]